MSESKEVLDELRDVLIRLKQATGIDRTTTVLGRRVTSWDTGRLNQILIKVDALLNEWFDCEEYDAEGSQTIVETYPEIYDLRSALAWNQLRVCLSRTGLVSEAHIPELIAKLKSQYQQGGSDE